ncbi:peptidoglycan D,D-transpeptidase FtsI family protein [Lacticaseibacillus daqingensis]|uniref:peptidoglycan D,D-transpeptidase FtsI family protein n=1 Tax=Lacticaseibacillus daqingensis TaxID=2486014 RepID=UPI000F76F246|nr:penicillin-binding protein 2 [Lacticaseibacillus daqingensis]
MKYIRTPKPKRERSHIPFRLNLLFFFVFVLLAALVAQLAYLQIMNGERFKADVDSTGSAVVTGSVPRGQIYDSQGRELVANQANSAIVYTKGLGVTAKQMRKTADTLAKYITVPVENLSKGDMADYYLADEAVTKAVLAKLPLSMQKSTDTSAQYKAARAYAEKHLPAYSDHEQEAIMIFKKLNGASQLTTVYVKDADVTEAEVASVGENLTKMPGINLGTNWSRTYPNGTSMSGIIGTVSTEKAGLPEESVNAYLANGYARNDRVGTSYLEKAYENILKGAKSRTQVEIGNSNNIVNQIVDFKGAQGDNLNLTIDSAYQAKVQETVTNVFNQALANGHASLSDGAYAVAINPKTGALLAIAGRQHNVKTGQVTDDALGPINRTFVMGSIAKPAMVLGALQDGVITTTNNTQADTAIYLRGTPVKKSDYPLGTFASLTAVQALERSSNMYMMWLAIKEGGGENTYVPGQSLRLNENIFTKMRGYFNQFGLGVKTGIDLPGEVLGVPGAEHNEYGQLAVGSALDMSYGNYDPYTLIQEAQYAATVANNGYRMKPYVVQSISKTLSDGSAGPVVQTTTPTVLSKIKNSQDQIDLVKLGMWQVIHGTSGWSTGRALSTLNPGVAGKTGTAESFARVDPDDSTSTQVETITQSFIGFAPAKDPQVAIAVVVPNLSKMTDYAKDIAKQMFQDYYTINDIQPEAGYNADAYNIN